MSVFSERMKSLRGRVPKSVVSAELGVKPSTFATYENGTIEPSLSLICRIAAYYHVSTDYLLGVSDSAAVTVSNSGNAAVNGSTSNASCAECPLARTVERQAALIERLSLAVKEQAGR